MTIPSEFVRVVKVLLPEDGGVAVETAVGAAVGVTSGPIFRIVERTCAICVIAGLMPLSEICIICYLQLQRTRSENGNTIGLIQALVHGNAIMGVCRGVWGTLSGGQCEGAPETCSFLLFASVGGKL